MFLKLVTTSSSVIKPFHATGPLLDPPKTGNLFMFLGDIEKTSNMK